jgi:hypothetical protein
MRSNGRDEDGLSIPDVIAIRATEKALLCRIGTRELVVSSWLS